MKDWKTTLGGALSGIAAIASGIGLMLKGQNEAGFSAIVAGVGLIWTGFHAKDSKSQEGDPK